MNSNLFRIDSLDLSFVQALCATYGQVFELTIVVCCLPGIHGSECSAHGKFGSAVRAFLVQELFENHKSIEVINTSAIYLFSLIYLFKIFQLRLVQFESKIPASVFITLDQYVSIKYFEPKLSKNFKIDVETKFITLKSPNSVYLQFVCSDYSGKRGYTFYALTENETKNSFIDKIRLKNLKKQIHLENKGKVLFPGVSKKYKLFLISIINYTQMYP